MFHDTGVTGQYPTEALRFRSSLATGTSYPNVTPTTDEPYYPPPVEGEVRAMTDYAGQAPPRREYSDVPDPDAGTKSIGEALGDVTRDCRSCSSKRWRSRRPRYASPSTELVRRLACSPAPPIAAFLVVLFLSLALWEALGESNGSGWGAVIVAVTWLIGRPGALLRSPK